MVSLDADVVDKLIAKRQVLEQDLIMAKANFEKIG